MKLKNILRQHVEFSSPLSLSKSLGDGYLFQHNEIFRQVRTQAHFYGFAYSCKHNDLYSSLPLSQLDSVLLNKIIPFQNNVDVLEQLESKIPQQIEWDHICDNIKKNHVFHESCHAIARTLIFRLPQYSKLKDNLQIRISLMLLEESFANTCELLAVSDIHETLHRIFFEISSYICMFEDKTHFKNAFSEIGRDNLFKFILLSYFHANFLHDKMSDKDFQRCLRLSFGADLIPSQKVNKTLRSLAKNAFALNPRFRLVTTSLFLRMNGIPQESHQALKFDHLKIIEESSILQKLIENLSQFDRSI